MPIVPHRIASSLTLLLLCVTSAPGLTKAPTEVTRTAEEVRFPSGPGTMLAGTLEKPSGFGRRRTPAVVIVAGTGPWTRGGFEKIRAHLLGSGIAVLQYDKRGVGKSTGTFVDTLPVMEGDVAASVEFLRTRQDIDPARIALIGHSQGGVAVPAVASRDPRVAAVVVLSGPVGTRGELFLGILRANLRSGGKRQVDADRVATAVGKWMEARSRGADAATVSQTRAAAIAAFSSVGLSDGALAVLDNSVVLSMYEAAPSQALSRIRVPVLAVFGSKDDVIAPELSVAAATTALASNPDALVLSVPGAKHELAPAVEEPKAARLAGDHMVPAVVDVVGEWLTKRLVVRP
jgi:pimeloyl-ACP methyl ester carboxylesterase